MNVQQSRAHHYVPQWYQKRFLLPGATRFYYLDLHPDTVLNGKHRYQRNALLRWGPARCFFKDNLYTLKLGNWTTDEIETRFFGSIDRRGQEAVKVFGEYAGYSDVVHEVIQALPRYMDAQRFRTPRGLDQLKALTKAKDHNLTLVAMQRLFRYHTTMWMEGVWEIVSARQSATKFIVTDEPVTFFNRRVFPSEALFSGQIELDQVGTRTLFPLSLDACLIITHVQFTRNPWINPTVARTNARAYQPTLKYLLDIQFGRELEEDEVLRINIILKRRATRYIAASEEEWLHPERRVSSTDWSKLDDDWFLLPHLYKVPFTSEIILGRDDGSAWAMDEYGRNPTNPRYKDRALHTKEWATHLRAREEWAKRRKGKSVAHVDKRGREDTVADKIMQDYLSTVEVTPST